MEKMQLFKSMGDRIVRKRKVKKIQPGKVIRLSPEVLDALERKRKETESFDLIIRRLLGMPTRRGTPQAENLFECYLLKESLQGFSKLSDAKGVAIIQAVRKKATKPESPIKVREVL